MSFITSWIDRKIWSQALVIPAYYTQFCKIQDQAPLKQNKMERRFPNKAAKKPYDRAEHGRNKYTICRAMASWALVCSTFIEAENAGYKLLVRDSAALRPYTGKRATLEVDAEKSDCSVWACVNPVRQALRASLWFPISAKNSYTGYIHKSLLVHSNNLYGPSNLKTSNGIEWSQCSKWSFWKVGNLQMFMSHQQTCHKYTVKIKQYQLTCISEAPGYMIGSLRPCRFSSSCNILAKTSSS